MPGLTKKFKRDKKTNAVYQFGGKCQLCGYNKCIASLHFHHIFGDKESKPSIAIRELSWERAIKVLDTCILLCANCHNYVHYNNIKLNPKTYLKLTVKCKCDQCGNIVLTKNKKQRYCSDLCNKIANEKITKPNILQLNYLLHETTFTQIGRMFNVSDNAVRKWAKKFKLLK
jgi:hypothetical protein